ncbi:MAG: carboxypeptidase-like regulatory domain-containing protein [Ginsengibacter sp.]
MQGISVALIDSYDGATTDSSGNFSFTTSEKGEQILKATATDYKPFEEKINITSTPIVLNIQLKEEITELKAVVMITLSAKRFVYLAYFISLE